MAFRDDRTTMKSHDFIIFNMHVQFPLFLTVFPLAICEKRGFMMNIYSMYILLNYQKCLLDDEVHSTQKATKLCSSVCGWPMSPSHVLVQFCRLFASRVEQHSWLVA